VTCKTRQVTHDTTLRLTQVTPDTRHKTDASHSWHDITTDTAEYNSNEPTDSWRICATEMTHLWQERDDGICRAFSNNILVQNVHLCFHVSQTPMPQPYP